MLARIGATVPRRKEGDQMAGVIDHVDIVVRDLPASKEFYEAALEPLGFALIFEDADAAGFGTQKKR